MDTSKLTAAQLYSIIQSDTINKDIRDLSNAEFENRKITIDEVKQIVMNHEAQYLKDNNGDIGNETSLKTIHKMLLLAVPFLMNFVLLGYFLSQLQQPRKNKQRKEFMKYYVGGLLIWMVILILWAKYFLFQK